MAEDAVGDGSPEHGQLAGEGDFGDSADDVPLPYRGLDEALHLIDEDDEDDDEDDDEEAEDVDAAGVGGGTAPKRSSNHTFVDIIVLVGDVDKNGSLTLDEANAALTGWGKNTTRKEPKFGSDGWTHVTTYSKKDAGQRRLERNKEWKYRIKECSGAKVRDRSGRGKSGKKQPEPLTEQAKAKLLELFNAGARVPDALFPQYVDAVTADPSLPTLSKSRVKNHLKNVLKPAVGEFDMGKFQFSLNDTLQFADVNMDLFDTRHDAFVIKHWVDPQGYDPYGDLQTWEPSRKEREGKKGPCIRVTSSTSFLLSLGKPGGGGTSVADAAHKTSNCKTACASCALREFSIW